MSDLMREKLIARQHHCGKMPACYTVFLDYSEHDPHDNVLRRIIRHSINASLFALFSKKGG